MAADQAESFTVTPAKRDTNGDMIPMAQPPADRKQFEAVFPTLIKDLSDHVGQYGLPNNSLQWFQKVPLCDIVFDNSSPPH